MSLIFLLLDPKIKVRSKERLIRAPSWIHEFSHLSTLYDIKPARLIGKGRTIYGGGGLYKLEPEELHSRSAEPILEAIGHPISKPSVFKVSCSRLYDL